MIDDREIATIRIEQLREAIAGLKTKKTDRKENTDTYDSKQYSRGGWREEVDISRIVHPLHANPGPGGEIVGENPIHGHKNKKNEGKNNFSVNTQKNVWHCFSCDSGGGWVEWLAVREGIIRCEDAGPNCLTREQYIQVMRVAEDEGLIEPYQSRHHAPIARSVAEGEAPSDVQVFKEFPRHTNPNRHDSASCCTEKREDLRSREADGAGRRRKLFYAHSCRCRARDSYFQGFGWQERCLGRREDTTRSMPVQR